MDEGVTQTSTSRRRADPPSADGMKERAPRSPGTRLLLSRLPVTILAVAYAIVFLVHQLPELAGVRALAQLARQASVLVWSSLPGTGGVGAADADGVFLVLATAGAIVLAIVGTWPAVSAPAVPAYLRWLYPWLALPAAALVAVGLGLRVIAVLGQRSWSPLPAGGLAFGLLAAVTAIFAFREIVLAPPAGQSRTADAGLGGGARRGTRWLVLIALTWIGDVAIGRFYEPKLIAAIAAVAPSKRWHYLGDHSSWWLYLLGVLVVLIGYAFVQLLPPWNGRARQVVIAAILIIAGFIAFQEVHPYATTAVIHVLQHPPSGV